MNPAWGKSFFRDGVCIMIPYMIVYTWIWPGKAYSSCGVTCLLLDPSLGVIFIIFFVFLVINLVHHQVCPPPDLPSANTSTVCIPTVLKRFLCKNTHQFPGCIAKTLWRIAGRRYRLEISGHVALVCGLVGHKNRIFWGAVIFLNIQRTYFILFFGWKMQTNGTETRAGPFHVAPPSWCNTAPGSPATNTEEHMLQLSPQEIPWHLNSRDPWKPSRRSSSPPPVRRMFKQITENIPKTNSVGHQLENLKTKTCDRMIVPL